MLGDLGRSLKHADKALEAALEHADLLRAQIITQEEEATRDVLHATEQSRELRKENSRLSGELESRNRELSEATRELERLRTAHVAELRREQQRASEAVKTKTAALEKQVADLEAAATKHAEVLALKAERVRSLESKQAEVANSYHLDRAEFERRLEEKEIALREVEAQRSREHGEAMRELARQYESEKALRSSLFGENVTLRDRLEASESRQRGLEESIESLKGQLAKAERIGSERASVGQAELQRRLDDAEAEVVRLLQVAQESQAQLDSMKEELAANHTGKLALEREIKQYKEAISKQGAAHKELVEKLQAYETRIQSFEQEISEMAEAHTRSIALARIGRED